MRFKEVKLPESDIEHISDTKAQQQDIKIRPSITLEEADALYEDLFLEQIAQQ